MNRKFISHGLEHFLKKNFPLMQNKIFEHILFRIIGIYGMDKIYNKVCNLHNNSDFVDKFFDIKNVELNISAEQLALIPATGPLLIVANHPYGAIEGLAMMSLLKRVRGDMKLMVNFILKEIPELHDDLVLVDPLGDENKSRNSLGGIRNTIKWLNKGHVIGIFPAGKVSCYNRDKHKVTDLQWSKFVGTLAQRVKCDVQCIFFEGRSSNFSQFLGIINPILQLLWIPREFIRFRNRSLTVRIGEVISSDELNNYEKPEDLIDFLRQKTYSLAVKDT